jgi:hypothetical protein
MNQPWLFSKPFGINLSIGTYDPQHTNEHLPCELARPIASIRHRCRRCRRPSSPPGGWNLLHLLLKPESDQPRRARSWPRVNRRPRWSLLPEAPALAGSGYREGQSGGPGWPWSCPRGVRGPLSSLACAHNILSYIYIFVKSSGPLMVGRSPGAFA